jgi:ribosomal protein S18 acetylase RimI-like enzyme
VTGRVVVRPYRAADRGRVRDIAYRTGFLGDPADCYWRDEESFANVWTGYYTDREPQSAFVAERDGAVVGFLLGCVDSSRADSPKVALVREIRRRLLFVRPGTAGFLWRSIFDGLRGVTAPSGDLDDPRWPAHLHVDLLPEARRGGAGTALMQAWFERLRALGAAGCHLVTLHENRPAVAFFERMGFRRHGPAQLLPGMRMPDGARMHQQVMVRDVESSG